MNSSPATRYVGLTDAQKAVLEPPYIKAQQRPELGDDGELTAEGVIPHHETFSTTIQPLYSSTKG